MAQQLITMNNNDTTISFPMGTREHTIGRPLTSHQCVGIASRCVNGLSGCAYTRCNSEITTDTRSIALGLT